MNEDKFIGFEELALGSRLKRLSDYLMKETSKVYDELAIDFDPYHMPIFKLLSEQPQLNTGMISKLLFVTQPAITQYVNALEKKGLILSKTGKEDKRKKEISLSKKGGKLLKVLKPVWKIIDAEIKQLTSNRQNSTLLEHISFMENKFMKKSFSNRILAKKDIMLNPKNIEIISFKEEYAPFFRDLNIEWLEKYFYVEEHDSEVLENAKAYIIDNNGYIFFAKCNNEIVGTVALMNEKEGYELSKMAVTPKYQGFKIGQLLMQHCIDFARSKSWDKLLLYSNTKLENSIYIYRKFGFKEVALEKDSPYSRSNIKMILSLT